MSVVGMDSVERFGGDLSGLAMVLRQEASSAEGRAVGQACLMLDIPSTRCDIEGLAAHSEGLRSGGVLPVGSVEFVREAFSAAGMKEPDPMSYPDALGWFLRRAVRVTTAGGVKPGEFVKPVRTKLFTGFVMPAEDQAACLSEHDGEQLLGLRRCDPDEPVYAAAKVGWQSEWRIYVSSGREIGRARYDQDGSDDAPEPNAAEVERALLDMVQEAGNEGAYSLDLGVMDDGRTALVEVNDAFALGLYGKALVPAAYLGMLWKRWRQIASGA